MRARTPSCIIAWRAASLSACLLATRLQAQTLNIDPDPNRADPRTVLSPGLRKLSGTEPTQHIQYARIFLDGRMVPAGSPPNTQASLPNTKDRPPVLIAQCTRPSNGRLRFELFLNYGLVNDFTYHPPWRSSGPDDPFPPRTEKTPIIFNFYGYINWKPIRRQWEAQVSPVGELRYNPPSAGSSNMEEVTFYLQYLKALPTLRLTSGTYAAQFETAPWVAAVHSEPLCAASGL
jgi:hypothetical protein